MALISYKCTPVVSSPLGQLTIIADWANLESKFLIPISKIGHSYVDDG